MKVLLISPTQKGIGGIAQHVSGLANFLTSNGNSVEIISSENTLTIPIKGLKNPSFMLSAFFKTRTKKDYQIIHAHNIPAALALKNMPGKKILTLHGIYSEQIEILHGKTTSDISNNFENHALNWADKITVISKEAYDYYTKRGFTVHHIPNAIDIDSLPKQSDKRYENQIVFAGRLSKEKGILTLLESVKSFPSNFHLLILGSGPEEHKIREMEKKYPNLHFLGYQKKEKTIEIIRGSDILVQPSLAEGISSTLLEAMACKTPIITTNVGGNKEILQNGKTGILIEPESPEQITQAICDIQSNKEKALNLSNEALAEVRKYDWSVVGKKYLEIYGS